MDEALPNDAVLMRYLDNEMPPGEKAAFELRLQTDSQLQEQLLAFRVAVAAVRDYGLKATVQRLHQEQMGQQKTGGRVVSMRPRIRPLLAVAAAVLVLILAGAGWWLSRLSADGLYKSHMVAYVASNTRGVSDNNRLVQLYSEGNFTAVTNAAQQQPLSAQDSLLTGLSYLQQSQLPQAIQWLHTISIGNGRYQPDAAYYLSFAYLKAGNYGAAISQLEAIRQNKDHLYHQQVSAGLLRKLKLLRLKQ